MPMGVPMNRRLLRQRITMIGFPLVGLASAWYFGLFDPGPRFRFKSAKQWSATIRRGDSVFDNPSGADGRSIYQFEPHSGEWSYYLCRLRSSVSFIWRV